MKREQKQPAPAQESAQKSGTPSMSSNASDLEIRAHIALRDHAHFGEWFTCSAETARASRGGERG